MAEKKKKKIVKVSSEKDKGQPATGWRHYVFVACCPLCTLAVYLYPALHNGFTNYDDGEYVIGNQLLLSGSIKLFTSGVIGNWAPVHMLLLWCEYHVFGLNPVAYHLVSLLLHLCNVVLIYYVILKLLNKPVAAFVAALLFGIHPMHVESVAWVSAQKDLLYVLFYLSAICTYIRLKETDGDGPACKNKYLWFTAVFFVLACLSKAMAITLPLILVLIDGLRENNHDWRFLARSVVHKTGYFLIAVAVGIIAWLVQGKRGTLHMVTGHAPVEQCMFACYGLMVYVIKFAAPFGLSAFYFYPVKNASNYYPVIFYLSPVIVMLAAAGIFWLVTRKIKGTQLSNILWFGALFFVVNLALVLQLKPVGNAILAERYTYLSYTGLLFITGWICSVLWEKYFYQSKSIMVVAGCMVIVVYGLAANQYASVWHDSITLWTYVIDNAPPGRMLNKEMAYYNRGLEYEEEGRYDSALPDFDTSVRLNPRFSDAYNCRGIAYMHTNKPELAITDFNTAIAIDSFGNLPYYNLGLIYANLGKTDPAIDYYTTAIRLNPQYADAYDDRGLAYIKLGKYDKAMIDFNKAVELAPTFVLAYNNRGCAYKDMQRLDLAIADFSKAISINPQFALAYNNRAWAERKSGDNNNAQMDFDKARSLGYFER